MLNKILLVIAILVSLGTAYVGYENHNKFVQTKDTLAATEATLKETQGILAKTQEDLKTTQETLAATEATLEKTQGELATTKTNLEKTTADLVTANQDLQKQRDEVARLTNELDAKIQEIAEITKSISGDNGEDVDPGVNPVEELQTQLAEKDALIEQLRAKSAAEATELAELREREQARAEKRVRQGLEGKILAINPAWNFVVLNVGDRNGVVNNAELLIKRSGNLIGKVRITSVEPSTAIADIVANSVPSGVSIEPGDQVIYAAE
ncbi:MAG: hypothetical protein ACK5NG_00845 [Chthoniobacterales bacterium]